jgi:hypothetical protein
MSSLSESCWVRVRLSGDDRRQQRIDGAEQRQHDGVDHHVLPLLLRERGQLDARQAARHLADGAVGAAAEHEYCKQRAHHQREQLRRHEAAPAAGHQQQDRERHAAEGGLARVDLGDEVRQGPQRAEHAAGRRRITQQRWQLDDDQNEADARHEARDDRVGHHRDVAAELQHAEQDLEQPGHHDRRERHCHALLGVGGDHAHDDRREHDGHGPGGLGDQRRRAAEDRREEPDQHGAVQARLSAGAGRDTEGERHRQCDDGRGDAAEQVALGVVQAELIEDPHGRFPL